MSKRYEHLHYCEYRDTETGLVASNYVEVMNQQDQKIKELEHRLSNRIEPKFKPKQTIWFIRGSSNKRIDKGIVYGFVNDKCIRLKQHGNHLTRDLSDVFATEEEAKKHLEELKNG